jgi:hypothetical protein
MDPFAYAMGLIAVQDMNRQFDELESERVSAALATRRSSRLRRLANRLFAPRGRRSDHGARLTAHAGRN